MTEASPTCDRTTCADTTNAISSPESEDGVTRSDLPVGMIRDLFGQAPAPASPSASPASGGAMRMSGTSGQNSGVSSRSAALQSSLASRLRARMDVNGSPEYALTWRRWDMPSGPAIFALLASARRTSGNGCIGWQTPTAMNIGARLDPEKRRLYRESIGRTSLAPGSLAEQVCLYVIGWATPAARDWRSEKSSEAHQAKRLAERRGKALSVEATWCNAGMAGGALNPSFSAWLMGYPPEWCLCAMKAKRRK